MTGGGLEHITVLDLTQGVSGPMSTKLLSQMGARIVKVERPGVGDIIRHWDTHVQGMSSGQAWVNPGKESIAIDLRTPEGQDIVRQLAAHADVVMANFVPGVLEAWNLSAAELHEVNPALVICLISGFGQSGAYSDRAALDLIIQGESGVISTNGTPEEMAKVSLSVSDISAAMYATIAVLQSLLHRDRTGEGQVIDLALLDSVMTWTGYFPFMHWYQGLAPGRVGLHHHTMYPYGAFKTADDRHVIMAAGAGDLAWWRRFCEALGHPELGDDPRYLTNGTRIENRPTLQPIVENAVASQPLDYWVPRFHGYGIPVGELRDFPSAMDHPVLQERGLFIDVPGPEGPIRSVDYPPHFSTLEHVNRLGPRALGQDTLGILAELGLADDAAKDLLARGIVQVADSTASEAS